MSAIRTLLAALLILSLVAVTWLLRIDVLTPWSVIVMSIDIEELRKLAEAATPGPWISHPKGYYGAVCASENEFDLVAVTHGQRRNNVLANEAYIAAANPPPSSASSPKSSGCGTT